MMKVKDKVIADLHFGHEKVSALRGFATVEEHDETLIEQWNSSVSDNQVIWVLGDVGFGPMASIIDKVNRLRGRKVLVAGNHDKCWHRRGSVRNVRWALRQLANYNQAFDYVITSGVYYHSDLVPGGVILTHLPALGDHEEISRYDNVRPRRGSHPIICGHVHGAWKISEGQVNVGIEAIGMKPILLTDAVAEADPINGIGGSSNQIIEGTWNSFGLA